MAELKDLEQPTFPSKRMPQDIEDLSNKTPKLSTQQPNPSSNNNNNPESHLSLKERPINDNDDEDDDDDDDDVEDEDGDDEVDRKGKRVMRDDKGKGKLIEEEEEEDDSDDDDDSGESISGGDSDFSDDPLAEVDLNNILPSRTRRRTAHPGVHIASDTGKLGNAAAGVVDDGDDSDDSDA